MADRTVLDLDGLRARCLGNESLVFQILSKIDAALKDEFERFAEAWSRQDFDAVAARAHRLKGTSANIGAHALHEAAACLESAARNGQSDQVQQAFARLQTESHRLSDSIQQHHKSITA
jgi:HPt (histidine-containing phosphotransfer) domain-containing protein